MNVFVKDHESFFMAIYDYIVENFCIEPREFEIDSGLAITEALEATGSISYDPTHRKFEFFECPERSERASALHAHLSMENIILFCSEPELLAINYINRSVFGRDRHELILSLKEWLPTVTVNYVKATFVCSTPKSSWNVLGDEKYPRSTFLKTTSDVYPTYAADLFLYNRVKFLFDKEICLRESLVLLYDYVGSKIDESGCNRDDIGSTYSIKESSRVIIIHHQPCQLTSI